MMQFLPHTAIDKRKWDECIRHSPNGRVYALSWYLDCLSPGWAALVKDDYRMVFPLTWRKKFGITYLCQPPFCQQSGLFSVNGCEEKEVDAFLAYLAKKYKLADIALNTGCKAPKQGKAQLRNNYSLPMSGRYELLYKSYSKNTKRNLKDARGADMQWRPIKAPELTGLFRLNRGSNIKLLKNRDYLRLNELIRTAGALGMGQLRGLCNANGQFLAGAFWLHWRGRHYFIFSGMSSEGRDKKAMFHMVDTYIRDHAGTGGILDFEGSDIPGIARFYKGFGAVRESYPFLRINHLPIPLRWLK